MTNAGNYYSERPVYEMGRERLFHIKALLPPAGEVLDVGCGAGGLAAELARNGYVVDGTDISEEALKEAKPHLREGFLFDLTDEVLPEALKKESYDAIVVSEVLEHTFAPNEVLERLGTLLKPGGSIIVTVPNILFWKIRLRFLFGTFRYEKEGLLDFGHIRFFTPTYAREVFAESGFVIEREYHVYPNLEHRKLSWVGDIFPGLFAHNLAYLLKQKN